MRPILSSKTKIVNSVISQNPHTKLYVFANPAPPEYISFNIKYIN